MDFFKKGISGFTIKILALIFFGISTTLYKSKQRQAEAEKSPLSQLSSA